MPNIPLIQTWQRQLGIAKETTWGTGVTPTDGIPVKNPMVARRYASLIDDGYRGDATKDQGWYQGKGHTEASAETNAYADTLGHFLMGILGADSITGTGPYVHALKVAAVLPPSYTITDYTGLTATGQARQYPGHYFSDVELRYVAASEILRVSWKTQGKLDTAVAKPTETYTTQAPFLGWQSALTLNSAANAKLVDATISMKRPISMEEGSGGTQDVDMPSIGQLEVTGKLTFDAADEVDYLLFLNNTQPVFSLLFTSGANTLTIACNKMAAETAEFASGQPHFRLDMNFRGIKNATDAGPISFSLTNTRSTAY